MYTPNFQITPLILTNIEEIGHEFGYLSALHLPKEYQQEYIERIAAETVHASTAIEGNTLSQDQVEQVMRGESVRAITRDIREAKNYFQTLDHIKTLSKQTEKIAQQTILELHHKLISGVDDTIAGKYRTGQVRVGDYLPPEAWEVPVLMSDFIEWINQPTPQGLSPILYAGIAHYELVAIHPFQDGNGRTARAFITLYLKKNQYDITSSFALESYYNRERDAYYSALGTADRFRTDDGKPDLTKWLEYFTTGFLVEAVRAHSSIDALLASQQTYSGIALTKTQQTIMRITKQKGTAQTADYVEELQMTQRGVYKAIQKLVEFGLLTQAGERKGSRYTITKKGSLFSP